jgi:SAM-dependent methyltransferase
MHPTAMENCRAFLEAYHPAASRSREISVVDVGSLNVNGSLKELCRPPLRYTGVDLEAGEGVDIVQKDPYTLPFGDASVDVVLSSSCFEHCEMFWVLFLEVLRVLRPDGLFYLNAPSNGHFHRHPVDCWRFYPDAGNALIVWAKRNGYAPALLESYVSAQDKDVWNDFVAVFIKDEARAGQHARRILHGKRDVYNGIAPGREEFVNPEMLSEDQKKLFLIEGILSNRIKGSIKPG